MTRRQTLCMTLLLAVAVTVTGLAPSVAGAQVIGREVLGTLRATLLNGVTGTTDGAWIDFGGFGQATLHVSGITDATLQIRGSNNASKPADASHEIQLGADISADGIFRITGPFRWLKVRVPTYVSGTISAWVEATIGGGPPGITVDNATTSPAPVRLYGSGGTAVGLGGAPNTATAQVSCLNTATSVIASRATRRAFAVTNHGTTDVFLKKGGAAISTSNGHLLVGVKGATITISATEAWECIVASGSQTVSVTEEYD